MTKDEAQSRRGGTDGLFTKPSSFACDTLRLPKVVLKPEVILIDDPYSIIYLCVLGIVCGLISVF